MPTGIVIADNTLAVEAETRRGREKVLWVQEVSNYKELELKSKRLRLAFFEPSVIFRFTVLPFMPEREALLVAKREAEREFGKDGFIQCVVSEHFAEAEARKIKVMIAFVPRDIGKKYLDMASWFRDKGVSPQVLTPVSAALPLLAPTDELVCICYLQGLCLSIVSAKEGRPVFIRDVRISSREDAPREVIRSVIYFRSRFASSPKLLIIAGDFPEGSKETIKAEIEHEVEEIDKFSLAKALALGKGFKVNLLPYENPLLKYRIPILNAVTGVAAIIFATQLVQFMTAWSKKGELEGKLSLAKMELVERKQEIRKISSEVKWGEEETAKVEAVAKILEGRPYFKAAVKEVVASVPDKVVLNRISFHKDGSDWVISMTGKMEVKNTSEAQKMFDDLKNKLQKVKTVWKIKGADIIFKSRAGYIEAKFGLSLKLKPVTGIGEIELRGGEI